QAAPGAAAGERGAAGGLAGAAATPASRPPTCVPRNAGPAVTARNPRAGSSPAAAPAQGRPLRRHEPKTAAAVRTTAPALMASACRLPRVERMIPGFHSPKAPPSTPKTAKGMARPAAVRVDISPFNPAIATDR